MPITLYPSPRFQFNPDGPVVTETALFEGRFECRQHEWSSIASTDRGMFVTRTHRRENGKKRRIWKTSIRIDVEKERHLDSRGNLVEVIDLTKDQVKTEPEEEKEAYSHERRRDPPEVTYSDDEPRYSPC